MLRHFIILAAFGGSNNSMEQKGPGILYPLRGSNIPRSFRSSRAHSVHREETMFLQRHGESEANVSRIFACRNLDPNLTEKGERQIQEAADFYKLMTIDRIFTSPSARAVQTAEIISSKINVEYTIDKCLLEVDVGDLEGESGRDPKQLDLIISTVTEWVTNGNNISFPGGESRDKVMDRVSSAISLLSPYTILIGHLAFFLLLLWKLKMPFDEVNDLVIPQGGRAQYLISKGQLEIIGPAEQSH